MKCLSNTVCSTTDTQEVILHTYHKGVSQNEVVTVISYREPRFFRYVSYSFSGKGIRAVMSWNVQSPLTINPTQETYWKEKPKSVVASLGQEAVKYWEEHRVYRGFLKGLGSSILRWPEIQGIIWPDLWQVQWLVRIFFSCWTWPGQFPILGAVCGWEGYDSHYKQSIPGGAWSLVWLEWLQSLQRECLSTQVELTVYQQQCKHLYIDVNEVC